MRVQLAAVGRWRGKTASSSDGIGKNSAPKRNQGLRERPVFTAYRAVMRPHQTITAMRTMLKMIEASMAAPVDAFSAAYSNERAGADHEVESREIQETSGP